MNDLGSVVDTPLQRKKRRDLAVIQIGAVSALAIKLPSA